MKSIFETLGCFYSDIAACLPTSDLAGQSTIWAFLSSDGVQDGHHGKPAITRDREAFSMHESNHDAAISFSWS